jgi:hypothetical protein
MSNTDPRDRPGGLETIVDPDYSPTPLPPSIPPSR